MASEMNIILLRIRPKKDSHRQAIQDTDIIKYCPFSLLIILSVVPFFPPSSIFPVCIKGSSFLKWVKYTISINIWEIAYTYMYLSIYVCMHRCVSECTYEYYIYIYIYNYVLCVGNFILILVYMNLSPHNLFILH